MKKTFLPNTLLRNLIALIILASITACTQHKTSKDRKLQLPDENFVADEAQGALEFIKYCAACHGKNGMGSTQGPPLIHKIYKPGHHSDMSFYKAAQMGTYQHHWRFGNMAPIKNISPEKIAHIISYVRAEQRKAGIN